MSDCRIADPTLSAWAEIGLRKISIPCGQNLFYLDGRTLSSMSDLGFFCFRRVVDLRVER